MEGPEEDTSNAEEGVVEGKDEDTKEGMRRTQRRAQKIMWQRDIRRTWMKT